MNIRYYRFLTPLFVLMAMLMAACSEDVATDESQTLPEGMGRIRITIATPESDAGTTRSVNANPWENPDHSWEMLQTFKILICDASTNKVVDVITGDDTDMQLVEGSTSTYKRSRELHSGSLPAGSYKIYATANFDDGYAVGNTINLERTEKFPNGYSSTSDAFFGDRRNIPMTGKLDASVTVSNGTDTDAGIITVWRVMAKMQFYFTNESDKPIQILGVEVDPINQASSAGPGVYLFSKDDLTSTANLAPGATPQTGQEGITLPPAPEGENKKSAREDVGTFRYQPATAPLMLAAKNDGNSDEGSFFFYINETDATFTTTNNQYSLRYKIKRQKSDSPEEWYEEEIRYGVTTHHDLTSGGSYGGTNGGFNVIRRNDWIHIPIVLTDWQLRIEPLAFVPIAGYPATTVSNDALTATFSTGGMIALQPFVKKYSETIWRDFGNSEVEFVDISWKNNDGTNQSGDGKIVKTAFAYDPVTKCIIGELNQDKVGHNYMTTFVVNVTLGPASDTTKQYGYSFTFNVILQ